jgi:hypothetical protein
VFFGPSYREPTSLDLTARLEALPLIALERSRRFAGLTSNSKKLAR